MNQSEEIILQHINSVAVVTLNRPHVLNALREESIADLISLTNSIGNDPSVRALLITGAGRAFCSGEDLAVLKARLESGSDGLDAHVDGLQSLTRRLVGLHIPVIAVINGPAVGLGAEIAASCDVRIAGESATFSFPELTRGLSITNGGSYFLPRLIGHGMAMGLLLSGETLSASRAKDLGLVNEVVPDGELRDHALKLADDLASRAPSSVAALKRVMAGSWESTLEDALSRESEWVLHCFASEDVREGLSAFMDRRPARFGGSV